MFVERSDKNPILKPQRIHPWETEAVFNGCPVKKEVLFILFIEPFRYLVIIEWPR